MAMEQVQKQKYEKEEDESRETIFYLILSAGPLEAGPFINYS